jgi:predicted nucleotidyltransferase
MSNAGTPFGLDESTVARINDVFAQFSAVEGAILYGSRAKGTFKPGSDIDLALLGDTLTETQLLRLENQLDDLMLPYQFDICRFATLQNPQLIEHIQRVGQTFYRKSALTPAPY